jgi:hypothetical protein
LDCPSAPESSIRACGLDLVRSGNPDIASPYGAPSGAVHGESVITYWVRLRQQGHDGDWQPYQKIEANSPIEAAENVYGRHLDTIGSHYQVRALVRQAGQSAATALYDRSL